MKNFCKKHRKGLIIIGCVLICIILIFKVFLPKFQNKNEKQTTNRQLTTRLEKMDLNESLSLTGTIESCTVKNISSDIVNVKVVNVNANVGDYVNEGDVILTLDDEDVNEEKENAEDSYDLQAAKTEKTKSDAKDSIEQAKDNYDSQAQKQASNVSEALSSYQQAKEKQNEMNGNLSDATDAEQKAKEAYEKIKDNKKKLKSALEKAQKNEQEKQKEFDAANSAYEEAQNTGKDENGNIDASIYSAYQSAQTALDLAKMETQKAQNEYDEIDKAKQVYEDAKKRKEELQESLKEISQTTENAESKYNEAVSTQTETNEQNAKEISKKQADYSLTAMEADSQLKSQKKQMTAAEEKVSDCIVKAPVSGVITAINVESGDTYTGGTLFVIQDTSNFIVSASADEYDISSIEKGQDAIIKTDATEDKELKGTVSFVSPTPEDTSSQSMGGSNSGSSSSSSVSYPIEITLSDSDDNLRIGMTAKISIVKESAKSVFAVPYDCIETDETGKDYITVMAMNMTESNNLSPGKDNTNNKSNKPEDKENLSADNTNNDKSVPKNPNKDMADLGDSNTDKKVEIQSNKESTGFDYSNKENETKDNTQKIYVEKGMETDFYVEISSEELEEGMMVLLPSSYTENSSSASTDDSNKDSVLPFGNQGGPGERADMQGGPGAGGNGQGKGQTNF